RGALERRVGALGIGENVCFKGRTADMAGAYSSHSAFVLSSLYEGFGLVLIEAMRCGCTPVAFDCEYGPREILRNGESGIIVPFRGLSREERVAGLAEAICGLIEEPARSREMAERALAGRGRFDKEAIMDRWEALFGDIAAR
ncbi:MAG: glycosyltransferase, partial [Muribaculaceae bacterium]|nr:glycosyltransferase [Muribaculaceae bacterium]